MVRIPKYRPKARPAHGQALVEFQGRVTYLGKWGSSESRERYKRFLAENVLPLLSTTETAPAPTAYSVAQLAREFLRAAKREQSAKEFAHFRVAARYLVNFHAGPVSTFTARRFREFRDSIIAQPIDEQAAHNQRSRRKSTLSRNYVNTLGRRVVRLFQWGVSMDMVSPEILIGLRTVKGLRKRRSEARETPKIKPVADATIEATLPLLRPQVADIVRLQRLTGMRVGEVCVLRPCDLDQSGAVWLYRPQWHKGEHIDRDKIVPIGPLGQRVLAPYLSRPALAFCFSPRDSINDFNAERRVRRQTRRPPSQLARRKKRKPTRAPGVRYTASSVQQAIARACRRGKLPHWHTHQVRHTHSTETRRQFGLEAAQAAAGHATADVTQIYAERDLALAVRIAAETG
jgi:integrase